MAAFISSHRVAKHTQELVKKQKNISDKLKTKEVEMIQNMEELHATQEQLMLKEKRYKNTIKKLEARLNELTSKDQA